MLVSCALPEVAPMVPAARTADAPTTRASERFLLFIDRGSRYGLSIKYTIIRNLTITPAFDFWLNEVNSGCPLALVISVVHKIFRT